MRAKSDVDRVVRGRRCKLVAVDHVVDRPGRVEKPHGHVTPGRLVVPQHRAERDDARATCDEKKRAAERRLPDEVPTDRPAQLELVARAELVGEVPRYLTVVETLDGEDELPVLRRGGDRVAPLCLVAVLGREAHVDVLAGAMPRPLRQIEHDAARPRGFLDELDHRRDLPGQSP